jgi:macrolide-specific efflux system membrane fusion protein
MTQMTAQVFFVTASAKNVLTVPVSALHGPNHSQWMPGSKTATVLLMGADGKVQRRQVTVGVSNRVSAQIVSGLEEGEKVVASRKQTAATGNASSSRPRGGHYGGGMGRL